LWCGIQKSACSVAASLFHRLKDHDPWKVDDICDTGDCWKKFHDPNHNKLKYLYDFGSRFAGQSTVFQDPAWAKVTIVRDPLERVLSGYIDKCVNKYEYNVCPGKETTFHGLVTHILMTSDRDLNVHFKPQSTICDLDKYAKFYDVLVMGDPEIGDKALAILKRQGLEEYYYGWGKNGDQPMFKAKAVHGTGASKKYKEYFSKDLAELLYQRFRADYRTFHLPKPSWIDELS